MTQAFSIIDYLSGLTGFILDESILRRIAIDRDVESVENYSDLTERDKDLLLADILFTVLLSPTSLPSHQHQHGQFSMSIGKQEVKDRDALFRMMIRLYRRWDDPKLELVPEVACLEWHI
jgi:hypothetical protein